MVTLMHPMRKSLRPCSQQMLGTSFKRRWFNLASTLMWVMQEANFQVAKNRE